MRILVTGASGFLGSHVAELLTQKDHQVRCLVRPSSNIRFLQTLKSIEFVQGTLDDATSLRQAVTGIDAIIHCAGVTSTRIPKDFYSGNVDGTVALLESAKRYAPALQRFVHVSSMAAVGPASNNQPLLEDTTPSPVSHYGHSKLMAENKAREYAAELPVTIIRPPVIYGPRDRKFLFFFKTVRWGLFFLPQGGRACISTVYAADAAHALLKAITSPVASGNIYFIDDGVIRRFHELLAQLAACVSTPLHINIPLPVSLMKLIAYVEEKYSRLMHKNVGFSSDNVNELNQLYWACNSDKARQELNWTHTLDWLSGAKLTYAWYKEAGWL